MSYRIKPQIKLYTYRNNSFELQAIIDDYMECSFERNLYQAGTFTISINYNIPNAQLFQRGLFVQFGDDPYDFGEIIKITDAIGSDGKASQLRTITGYDARYILKRRVIKNMNANGTWQMTDKGETCLRNLIKDQCGTGAEEKRKLPISNTIPATENAIGKIYSVSESFSNLYEVCKTIATQSEIGWRMNFNGSTLTLEVYEGTDRRNTVQFSTSFDSLADGNFTDSAESFSNAIYVGGKGQNDDRDIYEGEDGTPEGLDRFECWDNQSSMTTESEYEAEALSMLTQYGQTVEVSGNGLAKSPYEYKEQYDVGDLITLAFSGKSAVVQILSVVERWAFGNYTINFSFGKPQNTLSDQLQLMLRKIQEASNKTKSTDSVRWYTIPTDTEMPKADVTYDTIGFIGTVGANATFKLYLDSERTGAKSYHVWIKQLGGTGKLTLTTGVTGAVNLTLGVGTYVAIISVDENGNIINVAETPTDTIEAGNSQPATSQGVANAISSAVGSPDVSQATGILPIEHGGTGADDKTEAEYNLIGSVETVETQPDDDRYLALRNQTVSATNGTFRWTKFSSVWEYFKSKISSVLGLTSSSYDGNSATASKINVGTSSTNTDYPLVFTENATAGNKNINTDTTVNPSYNPSTNLLKNAGNIFSNNLPYVGTVYSGSTYSDGYYLLAQLEGTGRGNHDLSVAGRVYWNPGGNNTVTDFIITCRGNQQTVSSYTFKVSGEAPLFATVQAVATNKFILRLYGQITKNYTRYNTVIENITSGDVSPLASNMSVTFPNTRVTSFTGTEISKYNLITKSNNAVALSGVVNIHTAGNVQAKTATLEGFVLTAGVRLTVYLENSNTVASATLNINGTGDKSVSISTTSGSSAVTTSNWYSGYWTAFYSGYGWYLTYLGATAEVGTAYYAYATSSANNASYASYSNYSEYSYQTARCTTSAGTASKTASMYSWTLASGSCFPIKFTNSNSYAGKITLNINSTGAKDIWINGEVSSSTNYTLPRGVYMCFYDGTKYMIDTVYGTPYARSSNIANKIRTSAPSSPEDGDIWIE